MVRISSHHISRVWRRQAFFPKQQEEKQVSCCERSERDHVQKCFLAAYLNLKEMRPIRFILLSLKHISLHAVHFLWSDEEPYSQLGEINRQTPSLHKAEDDMSHTGGCWKWPQYLLYFLFYYTRHVCSAGRYSCLSFPSMSLLQSHALSAFDRLTCTHALHLRVDNISAPLQCTEDPSISPSAWRPVRHTVHVTANQRGPAVEPHRRHSSSSSEFLWVSPDSEWVWRNSSYPALSIRIQLEILITHLVYS